jgi:hypothetical protein
VMVVMPDRYWRGWRTDRGGRAGHSERGSGAGSDGEGGQVDLAEKEDGLGWRKMVEKDGLGRRRGGRGEDGLGAAAR